MWFWQSKVEGRVTTRRMWVVAHKPAPCSRVYVHPHGSNCSVGRFVCRVPRFVCYSPSTARRCAVGVQLCPSVRSVAPHVPVASVCEEALGLGVLHTSAAPFRSLSTRGRWGAPLRPPARDTILVFQRSRRLSLSCLFGALVFFIGTKWPEACPQDILEGAVKFCAELLGGGHAGPTPPLRI